jgi:hypothetical protein
MAEDEPESGCQHFCDFDSRRIRQAKNLKRVARQRSGGGSPSASLLRSDAPAARNAGTPLIPFDSPPGCLRGRLPASISAISTPAFSILWRSPWVCRSWSLSLSLKPGKRTDQWGLAAVVKHLSLSHLAKIVLEIVASRLTRLSLGIKRFKKINSSPF